MNEKVGRFIKEQREKNHMSQTELASLMFVSRQAISQWENGVHLPDIDKLEPLADILHVELAELLKGENITDQKEQKNVLVDTIKTKNKQKKKIIKTFSIIIVVLVIILLAFLINYFINSYKSLKIYSVSYENENFEVYGVMVLSRTQTYFNIGTSHIDVQNMKLYVKNGEEEKTINQVEDSIIKIRNNAGYNETINYNNIEGLSKQIYLKITAKDDNEYDVPLEVYKFSENTNLFFFDKAEDINEELDPETSKKIPEKIKNEFTLEGDCYRLTHEKDNGVVIINYYYKTNKFEVYVNTDKECITWIYNKQIANIVYSKSINNETIEQWETNDINDERLKDFRENYYLKYFEE